MFLPVNMSSPWLGASSNDNVPEQGGRPLSVAGGDAAHEERSGKYSQLDHRPQLPLGIRRLSIASIKEQMTCLSPLWRSRSPS
jgi:hypothetical protein